MIAVVGGAARGRARRRLTADLDVPPGPPTGVGSRETAGSGVTVGARMPVGVAPLPGPVIVIALRYTDSPVGPFTELAVAEPARIGLRLGFCITISVVSAPPARVGGRLGWGFPRELGCLTWTVDGRDRVLRWEERGIEVRGRAGPGVLPVLVPLRSMQRRADGPVLVPGRVRALAHPCHVELVVPPADDLGGLVGSHPGLVLHGLRLLLRPARRPAGVLSTLRAPLRAPEPALSGAVVPAAATGTSPLRARRYSAGPPRAYSSVG
jgi:hypothetical protein